MSLLPGEAKPELREVSPGLILRRGTTYLRVIKVSGRRAECQVREGTSGRFTGETRTFHVGALLKLYRPA